MARLARVVVEGLHYHVTQRGNRRQRVFFHDTDYDAHRALLAEGCASAGVDVWAYCLMPNHVHLIRVPGQAGALSAALAEAHRRYSRRISVREGWRGYLWQGRFALAPVDEDHLLAAARYVEINPLRARLCDTAADWPWSSARAHLAGADDGLARVKSLLGRAGEWPAFLGQGLSPDPHRALQSAERNLQTCQMSHIRGF